MAEKTATARIAYFSDAERSGGAERYIEILASNLDRERFEPVLVTGGAEGLDPLREAMRDAGVEVIDTDYDSPLSPSKAFRFMKAIRRVGPDLVHLNMPGPFDASYGLAAPLSRLAGAGAVISTEHLPMIPSFPKARMLRRISSPWIDRVITVSEDNIRHLTKVHRVPRSKIVKIMNGIPDPAAGRERPRGGSRYVDRKVRLLTAGSLEHRKGQDVLLDAMSRLPAEYTLDIAGDGPEEPMLSQRLVDLGLGERVRMLGTRDDIYALLEDCDIFVLPSRLEATPYVIIEAMAFSRPVVASNVFGIPELVQEGKTGLLVEPDDPVQLAEALVSIGSDIENIKGMGRAARERFETRFECTRFIEETVSVYLVALGSPSVSSVR